MDDRQELKDLLKELLGELGIIPTEDPGPPPPEGDESEDDNPQHPVQLADVATKFW